MFLIKKGREIGTAVLTNLFLLPHEDTSLLLHFAIFLDSVSSWCFLGRDGHGIVLRAKFEVVFEFSFEEAAGTVVAFLVLERWRSLKFDALGFLELH
jgi:hypothetical protein